MADDVEKEFLGTWRIVECVSLTGTIEQTGIEGTEFTLDESGEVTWKVSEDAEPMPFFSCETYEVSMADPPALKFFGTFAGHIIEFKVEVSDDLMLLTYERCCMLQCQKVSSSDPKDDIPFSFIGALEQGYFADVTITADNNKEFKAHKAILSLGVSTVDWSSTPPPLSGLPEDVLSTTLHYLYSESLPRGLSEQAAKDCVRHLGKVPGFERFVDMCNTFLKNVALRQQITSLVSDMHSCADKIIDLFNGKTTGTSSSAGQSPVMETPGENLVANPAKLCYVVKQAIREACVAGAKLLILSDLFSRRKGELSREERHEIIKYAKSRLPVFMNQLRRFLEVIKQHTNGLTATQRQEIAGYLVPEVEKTLDTIAHFVIEIKTALEQVITSSSNSTAGSPTEKPGDKPADKPADKPHKHDKKSKKGQIVEAMGRTLKNALHRRELMKLKYFHDKTTTNFMHLMQKKENFSLMSQEEKIRSVAKNLEQLIDEVPLFLVRVEELMSALDEKVTWKEWKYLFKLGTSKVAWGLGKVVGHKPSLKAMISQICDMVHREQFNSSLVALGLSDPPATTTTTTTTTTTSTANGATSAMPKKVNPKTSPAKYAQLSSVESLCQSPLARDSSLAGGAVKLLREGRGTDMIFEIIVVQESGDVVVDHTHGEPVSRTDHSKEVDIHEIQAHCVIIAARCDWFRRALLSGMRESIDKKITVHDTNPSLFRLFLEYLYSGQLETNEMSTEQLADMMAIGDRYEVDSLKSLCENTLKHHLDEDSSLFLLSLAEQYNATALRSSALNFITEHPKVMESEVFEELPEHLQSEVADAVLWHGLDSRSRSLSGHSHTETPPSSVSGLSHTERLMAQLDIDSEDDKTNSSSSEEMNYVEDSGRLDACLDSLRDIVGDGVPREELVRVALAADYDVNRALNFFFSA